MSKSNLQLMPYTSNIEGIEEFEKKWNGYDPFVIATIVRTSGSTAAHPGAKSLVTLKGDIIGFTGGGCLKRAIIEASERAIRLQKPQLIRSMPKDLITDEEKNNKDISIFPSGCPSRGVVEVFVEPVAAKKTVLVYGETETSKAVRELCDYMNYDCQSAGEIAQNDRSVADSDQDVETIDNRFIVIATQGRGDKQALTKALNSSAEHIFFVASKLKADHWLKVMRDQGFSDQDMKRIVSPAGLDIGARYPREIAMSIIGQMIELENKADK